MNHERYRFLEFELDCARHELRRAGRPIKIENIPFDLLLLLAESRGCLVTREAMVERLWGPGVFRDTEQGINTAIRKLRLALSDDPQQPRYLQTVVGRGYRLIPPVTAESDVVDTAVAPAPRTVADLGTRTELSAGRETPKTRFIQRFRYRVAPCVALLALAVLAWWLWKAGLPGRSTRSMLAVLPFANLTGAPDQRYFSDGMTEEIITDLGRLDPKHLGVIARTSVLRYTDTTRSIHEIGRDLGVDYILEGSVRSDKENVRVTAQLIRVRDQSHLWAQSYDRESRAILGLERDVAAAIVREVNGRFLPHQPNRAVQAHAVNAEAYKLYFQGREMWNRRTEDGMRQSLVRFEKAQEIEPRYAAAYAGLADAYTALGYGNYLSPSEAFSKARSAAEKALALDPDAPEPHASLGYVNMYFDWNFPAAEAEFRKAIQLNPSFAIAHDWYGILLLAMRRGEEASGTGSRGSLRPVLAAHQDRCRIAAPLQGAKRTIRR